MSDKYCYSRNEEEFFGDFDSREEAAAELDGEGGWVGKVKHAYELFKRPEAIGEHIIEMLDEWLIDEIYAEDAILEATKEQHAELGNLVLNWMRANIEPNRFGVCEVKYVAAEKEAE